MCPNASARLSRPRKPRIKQKLWALTTTAILVFALMAVVGMLRVNSPMSVTKLNMLTESSIAEPNAAYQSWLVSDDMMESAVNSPPIEEESPGITDTSVGYVDRSYQSTLNHLDAAIATVPEGTSHGAAVAALISLEEQVNTYHRLRLKAIDATHRGDRTRVSRLAIVKAYHPSMAIDAAFDKLIQLATQVTHQNAASVHHSLSSLRLWLAIIAVIGAIVFTGLALLIIRWITNPLQRAVDALPAIAGRARDRSAHVEHANADEIGSTAASIDQVVGSLKDAIVAAAAARAEREARDAVVQRAAVEKAELEARQVEERAVLKARAAQEKVNA